MHKSSMIKLIKPNISRLDIEAVNRVLESGMLVNGPMVEKFERLLAGYLDVPYAACVSSGTAALHLALLASDIKTGDEVIVPALTFPATANAVEMIGAVPVFIDCTENGVNLDVNLIESKISSRTRGIMPVHGFGMPAQMDIIAGIARKHNLVVIEDAACALGSSYDDKKCGSFGDLAAFSFHPRKLLTTGEGGAIATFDKITAERIKSLRNHGWEKGEYANLGYNYRMTDIQAALGINQIEEYDLFITKRKTLAEKYWDALRGLDWLQPLIPDDRSDWNVQTLLCRVDDSIVLDELITFLRANQVETTIGTYCVPLTKYYRVKYGYSQDEFPNAARMYRQAISLPLWNEISDTEISKVVASLREFESRKMKVNV